MSSDNSGCREQVGLEARLDVAFDMASSSSQEVRDDEPLTLNNCEGYLWPDWSGPQVAGGYSPSAAVVGLLRGVRLVLTHHRMSQELLDDFVEPLSQYLRCDDEVTFVARAKHFLCSPMARYLGCEEPPRPDVVFTWTGGVRRWFRSRMKFCPKNTHLWWSFFQAKRACAPISEDYVRYTYEKHRRQMAAPDPIDDDTYTVIMAELAPVLSKLRDQMGRAVQSCIVLEGEQRPVPDSSSAHTASSSACYEATRKAGGQIRHLASVAFNESQPNGWLLRSMKFYPHVVIDGEFRTNHVVSFYESSDIDHFLSEVAREEIRVIDGVVGHELPRLKCMIQAVIEPLKARIISKGHAAPYYLAKTFQKSLHSAMRSWDCFRLIGRPISATDLLDLDAHSVQLYPGEGRSWFSIDYSSATDGLSARLSSGILRSVLPPDMSIAEQRRLLSVLAPHRCEYPPKSGVKPVDQENGQLMGSILSFPILCLANLGLYLATIRNDTRPLEQKLRGVLVNGDDMLYVAAPRLYAEHASLGKKCGLEFSVGKSYVHQTFASANSTCFHSPLNQTPGQDGLDRARGVRQINYLNTGLFFGNSKVMRVDSVDGVDASASGHLAVLGALLDGCFRASQEKDLAQMFLAYHKSELQYEAKGRNYFVHRSLGGLGARVPTGWEWTVAARHHAIAKRQIEKTSVKGARSCVEAKVFGPRSSPEVEDLFSHPTRPWDETEELEPVEYAWWPRVVLADGRRGRLFVDASRCLDKVQLISGICRTRLGNLE
jgi:hypothetical protein